MQQVLTEYIDEDKGEQMVYNTNLDSIFSADYSKNVSLDTFLNRPVRIQSYVWAEGGNLSIVISPWRDYFANVNIKKKLDNFAFIHCNLKIKVVINSSPFYYGCALMSYLPLPAYNGGKLFGGANEAVHESTRPHVWLYPQTNQGGELTLPFVYHKNWLSLIHTQDHIDMGTLVLRSITPLKNANSVVGTDVDIQVYAWAENVQVCGPTYELGPQSGVDEYDTEKKGVISKPASTVANYAYSLSDIPVIGKYAKATGMIANGVSNIASFLGFTNVPNIKDQDAFKSLPFGGLCSAEISTPIDKLTIDPKNELTIDNSVCGASQDDEMVIKNIITREAYFKQDTWTAARVTGDILTSLIINPNFYQQGVVGADGAHFSYTPLGYIGQLFDYWRGDIVVRYRFICSKYHRGRVMISWDPITENVAHAEEYNYNKIIDISETPDVEIVIPYLQKTTWQNMDHDLSGSPEPYAADSANGYVQITVVNAQSSPVSSADVIVLTSVRAADNFEFACPANLTDDKTFFGGAPQAGYEQYEDKPQCGRRRVNKITQAVIDRAEDLSEAARFYGEQAIRRDDILDEAYYKLKRLYKQKPQSGLEDASSFRYKTKTLRFIDQTDCPEAATLAHMGESIKSLRQLLRRSVYTRTSTYTGGSGNINCLALAKTTQSRMPLYNGYDPNGIHTTAAPINFYNYVKNVPLNWVGACFVGNRGAVHWHFNTQTGTPLSKISVARSKNYTLQQTYEGTIWNYLPSATESAKARFNSDINESGCAGLSLIDAKTQSGMSVSVPYYSKMKMAENNPDTRTLGFAKSQSNTDTMVLTVESSPIASVGNELANMAVHQYVSIGTDFNFVFFLNVPTVYRLNTIPAA